MYVYMLEMSYATICHIESTLIHTFNVEACRGAMTSFVAVSAAAELAVKAGQDHLSKPISFQGTAGRAVASTSL